MRLARAASACLVGKLLIVALGTFTLNAQPQQPSTESNETLQARVDDFKTPAPLPNSEFLLYQELSSVNADQVRYRNLADTTDTYATALQDIDAVRLQAPTLFSKVNGLDCKSTTAIDVVREVDSLKSRARPLRFRITADSPTLNAINTGSSEDTPEKQCNEMKRTLTTGAQNSIMNELQIFHDKIVAEQQKSQQRKQLATQIAELLGARKAQIQKKLNDLEGQQSVKDRLPWVIGLIGLLSILVLLVVRLFPLDLQSEWINSGQVIQFVTVMVLLSVIMALGLAGIITENTLGTLLGGIAGYVLSQGVGRAAAREVTRSVMEQATKKT